MSRLNRGIPRSKTRSNDCATSANESRECLCYCTTVRSSPRDSPFCYSLVTSRGRRRAARFSEVRKRAGLKDLSRLLRRVRGEGIGDRRHVTQLSIRRRRERCFRPEAQPPDRLHLAAVFSSFLAPRSPRARAKATTDSFDGPRTSRAMNY